MSCRCVGGGSACKRDPVAALGGRLKADSAVLCRLALLKFPADSWQAGTSMTLSLQVLTDVGMDAVQADELLAAAAGGGGAGSTTSAPSEEGSPTTGGGSSRSVSYDDFRRMLLSQPPSILTKVRECVQRRPLQVWLHLG